MTTNVDQRRPTRPQARGRDTTPEQQPGGGGHHDTRYCYLGEQRLTAMEAELPDGTVVLGVDEHTACLIDLAAGSMTVAGRGVVTIRRRGVSATFPAGSVRGLEELAQG